MLHGKEYVFMEMKCIFKVIYSFACRFTIEGFVTRFDALLIVLIVTKNCPHILLYVFSIVFYATQAG